MFRTLINVFRIPELRNKLLFTIAMLIVYRIGFYVPLPGVDAAHLKEMASASANSPLGVLSNYLTIFSGGTLGQSTIFGLGIMPYISASIILQLLGTVIPTLEKLKKEGEPGMRKINEWTRYLTVGICLIQGGMWMKTLVGAEGGTLLYQVVQDRYIGLFWLMGLVVLTAGSLFLMWLGEQIDQYGIGNGVSLIITAGIVSRMPSAVIQVFSQSPLANVWPNYQQHHDIKLALQRLFDVGSSTKYSLIMIALLIVTFVFVVAGSILLTQAQRRIKIQTAKHMRGRRVYGGTSQYLPLRVNHAGVMPIIFASSLMVVPVGIVSWVAQRYPANPVAHFFGYYFNYSTYLYEVFYMGMIFFFSYFWNTVQFQPKEMANQLRDYGSFIPGLRPGKRTADYLENVMTRITYVGAAFLCVIAIIPTLVHNLPGMLPGGKPLGPEDWVVTQNLGGTGLLIVISVMLDLVNRIEANLVMRNYGGFLESASTGNKLRDRLRGPAGRTRPGQPTPPSGPNPRGLPA